MPKMNIIDELRARGLVKQTVFEDDLKKLLDSGPQCFYIGFDPTADSLHVGHFVQLIVAKRLQEAGHRPIILIGGGTAMIGDPSGRTDLRSMMTRETIQHNVDCFKKQMARFIRFDEKDGAIVVDNADWLLGLNYIDFLREIGSCFSVNKMLTAECYKARMEKGLTFLEFNYMLMQSYDFLVLNRKYGCVLQCGGDDQWSNILAGADLIRRKEGKDAFAITFGLLTTSEGIKMGKTAKGAVWLDPAKTSPYDFFQYWRNIPDADVNKVFRVPLPHIPAARRDRRAHALQRRAHERGKGEAGIRTHPHGARQGRRRGRSREGEGGVLGGQRQYAVRRHPEGYDADSRSARCGGESAVQERSPQTHPRRRRTRGRCKSDGHRRRAHRQSARERLRPAKG